eukprot:m.149528 g.149528  ORF g.149528 m.149528 type:complete len:59 (+) comp16157_c0_seq23:1805-1981(+)
MPTAGRQLFPLESLDTPQAKSVQEMSQIRCHMVGGLRSAGALQQYFLSGDPSKDRDVR